MKKPYAPQGKFLWDFWIFAENGRYHLYHLQAPLHPDAHSRHRIASVGYAISENLIDWREMGTVLEASEDSAAWDSVSIWTGCTLKKDDTYYMFYTSRSQKDVLNDGYVGHTQRIGVALSHDLKTWTRYAGNPVVTADSDYYESQEEAYNKHQVCRDPFVALDEQSGTYYMFFTARDKHGDPRYRGCIGRAKSKDLLQWELMPPAASPHTFTDMEVPSLHYANGRWYMIFAVKEEWFSEEYKRAIYPEKPQTGELYLVADSLDGEFKPIDNINIITRTSDALYTGRIVKDPAGNDVFLAWNAGIDEGIQHGRDSYTLAAPLKVNYDASGRLILAR